MGALHDFPASLLSPAPFALGVFCCSGACSGRRCYVTLALRDLARVGVAAARRNKSPEAPLPAGSACLTNPAGDVCFPKEVVA